MILKYVRFQGELKVSLEIYLLSVRVCVLRFLFMVHGRAMTSASQEALTVA